MTLLRLSPLFPAIRLFALLLAFACLVPSTARATDLRLAVTDLVGPKELQTHFAPFARTLGTALGMAVTLVPVYSRTEAVDLLQRKELDLVFTGPAEYVVFRKRTMARPVVGLSRPDYFSVIAVRTDSGITDIADLKGRKVAFGPVGSTSHHLTPMQILADNGLDPRTDIRAVHTTLEKGWEALRRGGIAALGCNQRNFMLFRDKDPSVRPGAFRVLARSGDLPGDILLAGHHLRPEVVDTIRLIFLQKEQELYEALLQGPDNAKYRGTEFVTAPQDRDYDMVRAMYATIGYPAFADFVGDK